MAARPEPSLLRIASLRSQIAVLARGGEYETAVRLLREHAALDLELGLTADSLLRARQAAALAEKARDPTASAEALLVLALGMIRAGDADAALRASALAVTRSAAVPPPRQQRLLALAELVSGIAERIRGRLGPARTAFDRAREFAATAQRADLSGAVLVQLGLLDLAEGATDAAAACFSFAREFFRIARRPDAAARVAVLPLSAFAEAQRWTDVARLAPAIAHDAAKHGLHDIHARARGLEADAHAALGAPDALARARDAAELASRLAHGPERNELLLRARLRLVRLSPEPHEQLRHLEAALDQAVAADDVALLALLADGLLAELAAGRVPASAREILAELSAAFRRLGAHELADLAASAKAELE